MKPVSLFLSCLLFYPWTLLSQTGTWNKNLAIDSVDHVTTLAADTTGSSYAGLLRNAHGISEIYGEAKLVKTDQMGQQAWVLEFQGSSILAEVLTINGDVIIAGQTEMTTVLNNDTLPAGSMFVGLVSGSGTTQWIRTIDTLLGNHTRLAIGAGQVLLVTARSSFNQSYLLQYDLAGNFSQIKPLPGLSVSDMDVDKFDRVYITGIITGNTQVDSLAANPPFPYSNYLLQFNPQVQASWIIFTRYVTFDLHHRLVCMNGQAVVFQRVQDTTGMLGSYLMTINKNGQLLAQHEILSTNVIPAVELAVNDLKLVVAHDLWNFSNPAVDDTLALLVMDVGLNLQAAHQVVAQVPIDFFDNTFYRVAADTCGIHFASVYTSGSVAIDQQVLPGQFAGPDVLLTRFDICNAVSVGSARQPRPILIYPNPSPGMVHVSLPLSNTGTGTLQIHDLAGRLVNSFLWDGSARNLTIGQPGTYTITLIQDGQAPARGMVVVQ